MWTIQNSNFGNVIQIKYKNTASDIYEIEIYRHAANSWRVSVITSTVQIQQELESALVAARIPPNYLFGPTSDNRTCSFSTSNRSFIVNFLNAIKFKIMNFDEIENDLSSRFSIDFSQEYPMPVQRVSESLHEPQDTGILRLIDSLGLPITDNSPNAEEQFMSILATRFGVNQSTSRRVAAGILLAQTGIYGPGKSATSNADKISGVLEDKNIPENYICPLTMSIMTNPVYLPDDVTKKVFERSAITRWLSEKGATHPSRTGPHPFNPSARFSTTDLLPNNSLKKEIDAFVEQVLIDTNLRLKK